MKILKLMICAVIFMSASAYAQFDTEFDVSAAFKTEINAHDHSPVIQALIHEVEASYAVVCDGFTTPDYPYLQKHLTYKATCKGEDSKVKLTIKSSYAETKDGFVFVIRKYSLKIK